MKNMIQFKRVAALASLLFVVNCGLQVRSNPLTGLPNPNTGLPEKTYTVGGIAEGIRYEATDPGVPTGYYANLPAGITLLINGEEFFLDHNADFKFEQKFKSGEDYEVSILDNGIEIPNIDGISPPIYLNCDLGNTTGTIIDHDVTDVVVKCGFGDTPYADPA